MDQAPTLGTLLRKTFSTGIGALQNRGELFLVELREEESRLIQLVVRGVGALFLAIMTALLITGTIIYLVPENYRLYVVGGFAALYLAGTLWAIFSIKAMLKRVPFGDTIAQFKKDADAIHAFNE